VTTQLDALIGDGRAALATCEWVAARSAFERAAVIDETPEVSDGLGQALYWQGEYRRALALRERAYVGFHRRGEHRRAAMVAIRLAMLHGLIYGNATAVSGWLGHAQRNVERCDDCPEGGWVELFRACITADPQERAQRAELAMAVGRRHAVPGLEFDALGYLGKARVELGDAQGGMRLIDEAVAAAASGLVDDVWAAGEIYCTLFHTCELTIDARRAEDWLAAVDAYVDRTGELPISGICRMHYGGLLTAAGRWHEADVQLRTALEIYEGSYTGTRFGPALRLADLRARQGRIEEARRLLDGFEAHDEATLPTARLHLAAGRPELAAAVLERDVSQRGVCVVSVPSVALLVSAKLALSEHGRARELADDLARVADATGLVALVGFAALSQARVAVACGGDAAAVAFNRARSAFSEARLPYDLARTRLEYAATIADSQPQVAREEARAALDGLRACGASADVDEAASLLRRLGDTRRPGGRSVGTLTGREREVLGLLAEGLSNRAIAERLFISPRTAEHHVGNILRKLDLGSRAEATAYALRHRPAGAQR
jgi:DNA-binding CsgD family transcriptional regulator